MTNQNPDRELDRRIKEELKKLKGVCDQYGWPCPEDISRLLSYVRGWDHNGTIRAMSIYEATPAILALICSERQVERDRLIERVEEQLHHAEDNEHHLDRDCQGVAPGEFVPAVRISYIRQALGEWEKQ